MATKESPLRDCSAQVGRQFLRGFDHCCRGCVADTLREEQLRDFSFVGRFFLSAFVQTRHIVLLLGEGACCARGIAQYLSRLLVVTCCCFNCHVRLEALPSRDHGPEKFILASDVKQIGSGIRQITLKPFWGGLHDNISHHAVVCSFPFVVVVFQYPFFIRLSRRSARRHQQQSSVCCRRRHPHPERSELPEPCPLSATNPPRAPRYARATTSAAIASRRQLQLR